MVLLYTSSPTAISGLIVARVVDSINRHLWRRLTHVFQEGFKAIAPALAHFDAAAAVIGEVFAFRVVNASFDAAPNHINIRLRSLERMSVFAFAGMAVLRLISCLGFAATAANRMTIFQMGDVNDGHGSAIALAKPSRSSAFRHLKKTQNGQSTKTLTGYILECRHSDLSRRLLRLETASRPTAGPFRIYTTGAA